MPLLALRLVKQLPEGVAAGRLGVENCKHFMRGPVPSSRSFRRNLAYWVFGPLLAFSHASQRNYQSELRKREQRLFPVFDPIDFSFVSTTGQRNKDS